MAFSHFPCTDAMDITGRVPGRLNREGLGVQISSGWWATHLRLRPPELATHDARSHPFRIIHEVPCAIRAIAFLAEHPKCVISGISALALFGLPHLVDSCDTTVNTPVGKVDKQMGVAQRRRKPKTTWTVKWRGQRINVSSPPDAVVEALQDIRDGLHAWAKPAWVVDAKSFWSIQLVDAARRHLGVDAHEISKAAHRRLNRRWIDKVLALSSSLADSPKETELRLMCMEFATSLRAADLIFAEQVPLFDGSRLITTFDLALVDLKIAIMYDGEHHLSRGQRDKDAQINLECIVHGWTVIRVSAGTLEDLPRFLSRLLKERGVVG